MLPIEQIQGATPMNTADNLIVYECLESLATLAMALMFPILTLFVLL
jgi:hypothetical protein